MFIHVIIKLLRVYRPCGSLQKHYGDFDIQIYFSYLVAFVTHVKEIDKQTTK